MTTPSTELRTKSELEAKYNDATPLNMWGTVGQRNRSGVCVLATKEYDVCPAGEIRWKSNGQIVPGDILEMAVVDGTITIEQRNKSEDLRVIEDEIFLKNYINFRQKHGYSEEELMEINAEFGDDEPVDIFTGREIRTGKFVL